jgi:hypothetical protein
MKPPPHGGLRGLCGLKGAYKSNSVSLPSPVVSSSVLMDPNKGSSGGTERAVADQVSNCLELYLIVSKMKRRPFASACILAFLDFQPSGSRVRMLVRREWSCVPFLEELRDAMETGMCSG